MAWVAGNAGVIAWMNAIDAERAAFLVPVHGHVYRAAVQSLVSATVTRVAFDTVAPALTGGITQVAGAFTVPTNGLYLIVSQLAWNNSTLGMRAGYLTVNNPAGAAVVANEIASHIAMPTVSTNSPLVRLTRVKALTAGDLVECWAYQNTGGALDVGGLGDGPGAWLEVTRLQLTP